jgi:hypothetical protein
VKYSHSDRPYDPEYWTYINYHRKAAGLEPYIPAVQNAEPTDVAPRAITPMPPTEGTQEPIEDAWNPRSITPNRDSSDVQGMIYNSPTVPTDK